MTISILIFNNSIVVSSHKRKNYENKKSSACKESDLFEANSGKTYSEITKQGNAENKKEERR